VLGDEDNKLASQLFIGSDVRKEWWRCPPIASKEGADDNSSVMLMVHAWAHGQNRITRTSPLAASATGCAVQVGHGRSTARKTRPTWGMVKTQRTRAAGMLEATTRALTSTMGKLL
jgi:hypothetical protein